MRYFSPPEPRFIGSNLAPIGSLRGPLDKLVAEHDEKEQAKAKAAQPSAQPAAVAQPVAAAGVAAPAVAL